MKKKKRMIETSVLIVVFVAALWIFSFLTNRGDDNTTADLDGATCPKVSFQVNGYEVNSLTGYAKEMDVLTIRDAITPAINGAVTAKIDMSEKQITGIDYSVSSLDGKEILYQNKISEPQEEMVLTFSGEELLKEEKILKMTVTIGEEKIFYYTRIVEAKDANLKICMDYAKNFHSNALLKMEDQGIETAIETSEEGDNGTLGRVTIHSDFEHVTWGKLKPQVDENVRWTIKELNNSYTCLQLEYQAKCAGEENEQDEYKVEEFFKIRHSSKAKKTYLLEYDREMEQIFEPIRQVLGSTGVLLGITEEDVPYATNKDGTIVSFVQADDLWSYNKEENSLTQIFSFDSGEGYDERNLIRKHEIDILNHNNKDNIRFAVKGYMNRGSHEGEVGIAVYYYDAEEQTVKEEAFVAYEKALESDVYFNASLNVLYVLTEGTIHEFKLDYHTQDVIAQNLQEEEYKIAPAGNIIAYVDKKENEPAQKIIIKNLKKEEEQVISCEADETIIPLGFIGTDFIYGVSKIADAGTTISGQEIAPMYKVEIQNLDGKVEMTYEKAKRYILSVKIQDNMITLELAKKKGSVYTPEREDYITNNEGEEKQNVELETYVTELKERQKRLTFADGLDEVSPKILKANQTLSDKSILFELEQSEEYNDYDVYAYGELFGTYQELGEAIVDAKQHTGVVVDAAGNCVWEMSNRDLHYTIPADNTAITTLLNQLNKGKTPMEAAAKVPDAVTVDLSKCLTEDLLYILDQDIPIIAMTGTKKAVVLVGYNELSVYYMEPGDESRHSVSYEEMDEMTKNSGNTYIGVK